jgi:hypothetical protein
LQTAGELQGTGGGRKWTKRVQKEWKILENNNLPGTFEYSKPKASPFTKLTN